MIYSGVDLSRSSARVLDFPSRAPIETGVPEANAEAQPSPNDDGADAFKRLARFLTGKKDERPPARKRPGSKRTAQAAYVEAWAVDRAESQRGLYLNIVA